MKKAESEILSILKENSRTDILDIAKQVNLSKEETEKIIKDLETRKIINKYTILFDDKKILNSPKKVRALIELSIRPEKNTGFDQIARRIARFSQVIDHYLISGTYDFLLIVEGESLEEISTFVAEKLASIDNVKSTRTNFIMRKYKEDGYIFEEEQLQRLAIQP